MLLSLPCTRVYVKLSTPDMVACYNVDPGFSLIWDNVQKLVRAKHQNSDKQNKMKLWAMCLAAKNRVPYKGPSDVTTKAAKDIPLKQFVLSNEDWEEFKAYMMVLVQRVLVDHIPHLQQFKHVPPEHVLHEYSEEMGKKSEIVSFYLLVF